MTRRLYYENSYTSEFDATVLSCRPRENGYAVILDRTAFFPEGGGQPADTGTLGGVRVTDAHESDGQIVHYTDAPLTVGSGVHGELDFDRRFRLMQNHGGEHILSGIVHRRFGLNNVGFHMGSEDITVDYDGFLDRTQLLLLELEANRLVCENRTVTTFFPSAEELAGLEYRSKKALSGEIRIVSIEDCDTCACCAPHLAKTGEIGMIKLLDSFRYKGGVRVHLHCGFDALDDYNKKYDAVRAVSNLLSVKQDAAAGAVGHLFDEYAACRAELSRTRAELRALKIGQLSFREGNLCLFERDCRGDDLRKLAVEASGKCGGICAVFSGEDGNYSYVLVSGSVDLRARSKEINAAISGRGGGSPGMIQGSSAASRAVIESFFA